MNMEALLQQFYAILDGDADEEKIQQFLTRNPCFFPDLEHATAGIFAKVKLGSDYVTDFAYGCRVTSGISWVLMEIERPDRELFTKRGDISASLSHALTQVAMWRHWLATDYSRGVEVFPQLCNFTTKVVMGRRDALSEADKHLLAQLNKDNVSAVEIMTYDRLSESLIANPSRVGNRIVIGSFDDLREHRLPDRYQTADYQRLFVLRGQKESDGRFFRTSAYYPDVDASLLRCGIAEDKRCKYPNRPGIDCPLFPEAVKKELG